MFAIARFYKNEHFKNISMSAILVVLMKHPILS